MEKGLRNLQAIARSAHKKVVTAGGARQRGNDASREDDSGIAVPDEDAETEVGEENRQIVASPKPPAVQAAPSQDEHSERRLPPPLPLYQPPPSAQLRGHKANKSQDNERVGGDRL